MGVPLRQKPVKLVASIIFKDEEVLEYAEKSLRDLYGPLEPLARTDPFDRTDYYYPEFGRPLKRKLICFKRLAEKERMSGIKLRTNRIEARNRTDGKRRVNIDPGYVTEAKLVLLTTKDYTHRIYLGRRVFAESTLFYRDGTFCAWPWTYPDYASDDLIAYFNGVRRLYMRDIAAQDGEPGNSWRSWALSANI